MKIPAPYLAGLVLLRHRLAAEKQAENRAKIYAVHAASLHRSVVITAHAGLDKREAPGVRSPEASTTRKTLVEVPGGCSPKCAG